MTLPHQHITGIGPVADPPVRSLGSFTEQALSELKQHLAGEPVDANRIRGSVSGSQITGQLDSSANTVAGTGFSGSHGGTGSYTVTFTTAFAANPTVLVTPTTVDRMASVTSISTTAFTISVRTDTGSTGDTGFNFVAFETV